jgi:hypothetical protein
MMGMGLGVAGCGKHAFWETPHPEASGPDEGWVVVGWRQRRIDREFLAAQSALSRQAIDDYDMLQQIRTVRRRIMPVRNDCRRR